MANTRRPRLAAVDQASRESSTPANNNPQDVLGNELPPASQGITGPIAPVVVRPGLFKRLSQGVTRGVTLVSAPPGSGKTVLLRSWIEHTGLGNNFAWVLVNRNEADAQRFWIAIFEQLRAIPCVQAIVEALVSTPAFNGDAVVERLVSDLHSLKEQVVLVIDDLHELKAPEAQLQLANLIARLPPMLRIVLATRHDPSLGLHRLRLAGQLTELRAEDLAFSLEETRSILAASGITLSEESVSQIHRKTEGWAAGLRLATLSLTDEPDPERFVTTFAGSERTVSDYLMAEVLERQPYEVRQVLLRTSILERVNGSIADAIIGGIGSERILLELEQANAFVIALDAQRTWFRYHQLFADLLRLELRRKEPEAIPGLHRKAAAWYAEHGYVIDAVRHARTAEDWTHGSHLLTDHIISLLLNGHQASVRALLIGFPEGVFSDPQVDLVRAYCQLVGGSIDQAAKYIALAVRHSSEVPEERRHQFNLLLAVARISLACRSGDFRSVFSDTKSLLEIDPMAPESLDIVAINGDAQAVGLMNLGIAEAWSWQYDEAKVHLTQALDLARRIGRPYIEVGCLSHLTLAGGRQSFSRERERCVEAIAIAERHGWAEEPVVAVALATMGAADLWQGRFVDARTWIGRAERSLPPDLEPTTELYIRILWGILDLSQGRLELALACFRAAEEIQRKLIDRHALSIWVQQFMVHTLVRLGETPGAHIILGAVIDDELDSGELRVARASLHLAEGDATECIQILAPVLSGSPLVLNELTIIQSHLWNALAQSELGNVRSAQGDIERALDLAEPDGLILPFALVPVHELLERHQQHTMHASLVAEILDMMEGTALPPHTGQLGAPLESLSESELRVLRYLPSNLTAPEIAGELFLTTSTVKTHMRHIYAKLGIHRRAEAVEHARSLGLLAPSSRHRT